MQSWRCRLLTRAPEGVAAIGDMWYARHILEPGHSHVTFLSSYYYAHNHWRAPIIVVLPDGGEFCVDTRQLRQGAILQDGWTVVGKPPNLTLTPSIRTIGWHGWLTDGTLHSA